MNFEETKEQINTRKLVREFADDSRQEWAAVEGISIEEASAEIEALLEKGKQINDNE